MVTSWLLGKVGVNVGVTPGNLGGRESQDFFPSSIGGHYSSIPKLKAGNWTW